MKYLFLLTILLSRPSLAMDPFTIAMVASSAVQVVNSAGDASGSLDAFGELYLEIDTDAAISDEGQKLIDQIEEIHTLADEAGYSLDEIDRLGHQDGEEIKKLEGNIRAVTRAVRAGKNAFKLFQKLEQKAQNAQVESDSIQKEQLAQMYKMVRLQQESNLAETKRELVDQINKRHQIMSLRQELKDKGAKMYGKTGVLSFPKSERVIETSLEAASRLRPPLLALMLAVFLTRLIFYQFGFFGVSRMGDLVRDTILCSLLLVVYPEIVRATLTYTFDLAAHIGATKLQEIKPKELELPGLTNVVTSTKLVFLYAFEWIKYAAFAVIDFVMTFGLSFMVMLFPVVIFASQMMNFSIAWPIFLGGFISLAMWPLFWNLVGLAAELSWGQTQRTFAESLYSIFFTFLQVISPFIGIKLISGQPLSKAIGDSARAVSGPVAQGVRSAFQAKDNFSGGHGSMTGSAPSFQMRDGSGMPSAARTAGSLAGYASNQVQNRFKNAKEAMGSKSDVHSSYANPNNGPKASPLKAFALNNSKASEGNVLKHAIAGLKPQPMPSQNSNQERKA